jgi:hypothetical protein
MIPKGSALYLHAPQPNYDCDDCAAYLMADRRCALHGRDDYIGMEDSCGYFMPGAPGTLGFVPLGLLTKQQSGFAEDVSEASCKRCKSWDPENWACALVDKDSLGDDPGLIHPDACCCLWTKDPERGNLPTSWFTQRGYVERIV